MIALILSIWLQDTTTGTIYTAIWAHKLQPIQRRSTGPEGMDQNESIQRIIWIIIICLWSPGTIGTEITWRTPILCRLLRIERRNNYALLSITPDSRDSAKAVECPGIHQVGFQEYIQYNLNYWRRWMENSFQDPLSSIQIPGKAFWPD
jgi:hypothetical protein